MSHAAAKPLASRNRAVWARPAALQPLLVPLASLLLVLTLLGTGWRLRG